MSFITDYRYEKNQLWRTLTTKEMTIKREVRDRRTKSGYRTTGDSITVSVDGRWEAEKRVQSYRDLAEGIAYQNFEWKVWTLYYYKYVVNGKPWYVLLLAPILHLLEVIIYPFYFTIIKSRLSVFSKIIVVVYSLIIWLLYLAIEAAIVYGIIILIKHLCS